MLCLTFTNYNLHNNYSIYMYNEEEKKAKLDTYS